MNSETALTAVRAWSITLVMAQSIYGVVSCSPPPTHVD